MKKDEIIIYTDGSSLGNPGPAGWGALIVVGGEKVIEIGGREKESTNNRMELSAVIESLKLVQERKLIGNEIIIHADSSYVLNGITMWIYAWVKNNWKTKLGDSVLNQDLWEALYKIQSNLKNKYKIEWVKVAGHSGVYLNERCDQIATSFAGNNTTILFVGNTKDYEKLFGISLEDHKKKKASPTPGVGQKKKVQKGVGYSYVSLIKGKAYVDKTWEKCEKRVKGKSGAKYKKVFSKNEEQDLIAKWTLKSLL